MRGLIKTFREEQNIRVQILAGVVVLFFAWFFIITKIEWILLIILIGLVLLMEILNSAVERVTDMLKPRINTYDKEIKDIMAAAVMLSSLIAVIIGMIIFIPYIKDFLI
jgi:diacylglycerol kinase